MTHQYLLFSKNTNQHKIESLVTANFISKHFPKNKLSVLDMGCGSGLLLKKILSKVNKNFIVDYLDPDKEIFKLFEANLRSVRNVILNEKLIGSIEQLISKITNKYDIILCGHSLYYGKINIIYDLMRHLTPDGVLVVHISRKSSPGQKLFSIVINRNSSEDVKNFLRIRQIKYESKSVDFLVNVTPIKKYFEDHDKIEGKQFLQFFLYGKQNKELIKRAKNIIERHTIVKNRSFYLQGKSDIYFIKNTL